MEKLLIFLMVFASALYIWGKDVEISIMDRAYRSVQYGLEHAVHDGALQIQKDRVSSGKILFDKLKAEQAIVTTIRKNIPVDSSLRPLSSPSLLKEPLLIRDIIYLDHDYIDPKTAAVVKFPFMFSYTIPNGEVLDRAVFGPSIALVVDVSVKGGDGYKTYVTIQEYKKP
ncbi:hypothetical protein [Bacillus sp. 1P06AnD]|uniref:hypothetical protein n=1 Tax=Bacillus sp. 1P06AnD TaxID=3132208 RepID=UPI0039A28F22